MMWWSRGDQWPDRNQVLREGKEGGGSVTPSEQKSQDPQHHLVPPLPTLEGSWGFQAQKQQIQPNQFAGSSSSTWTCRRAGTSLLKALSSCITVKFLWKWIPTLPAPQNPAANTSVFTQHFCAAENYSPLPPWVQDVIAKVKSLVWKLCGRTSQYRTIQGVGSSDSTTEQGGKHSIHHWHLWVIPWVS